MPRRRGECTIAPAVVVLTVFACDPKPLARCPQYWTSDPRSRGSCREPEGWGDRFAVESAGGVYGFAVTTTGNCIAGRACSRGDCESRQRGGLQIHAYRVEDVQ